MSTWVQKGYSVVKIILTQDVPKLGQSGTVQDVANGYARNFLIPRGMATIATRGSIKQVEERQAAEAKRIAKQEEELRGLSERIQGMRIEIEARVGEQGRLYGSVTAPDIAERLSAALGEEIDRRKIDLDDPIRTVGEHEITIRLVGRLTPVVTVAVFDPEASAATAEDDAAVAEGGDGASEIEESAAPVDDDAAEDAE
ncbi:MAG TPA: 50S ribosomal protein L9 [Thermomicrobiales bacterium]|nr:50S ribosomal protein L9 [Thermomicrobiales bacterium]